MNPLSLNGPAHQLTPGQLAVRERVQRNLELYEKRHVPRTGRMEMTEALVSVLGADQRIVADSVTGKLVGYTNQALLLLESTLPMGINMCGMKEKGFTRAKDLYISTPPEDRSLIASFLSSHQDDWMSSRDLRGHQRMCECMAVFRRRLKMLERFRASSSLLRQRLGAENPFYEWLLSQFRTS